jgi:hypothetical protein
MKTFKNFQEISLIRIASIIVLILLSAAECSDENKTSSDSKLKSIEEDYDAEFMVTEIADGIIDPNVLSALSRGSYTGKVVSGLSGTATVSGLVDYSSHVSCGSDCVKSETDINLTIVFDEYRVMSCTNCESVITGTVNYINNLWSRQSGLYYSSGGLIYLEGTDVALKIMIDEGSWGYDDIINFDASGSSSMSGWCKASDGNTYSF